MASITSIFRRGGWGLAGGGEVSNSDGGQSCSYWRLKQAGDTEVLTNQMCSREVPPAKRYNIQIFQKVFRPLHLFHILGCILVRKSLKKCSLTNLH